MLFTFDANCVAERESRMPGDLEAGLTERGVLLEPTCGAERPARWFVLQARHESLGYPIAESRFQTSDLNALRAIVGKEADDDVELHDCYELDHKDLSTLSDRFGARCDPSLHLVYIMPWQASRDAPYLNHAGFELPLMLEGRKPFAKFSDAYPSEWLEELLGMFDPFVAGGQLLRRIVRRPPEKACPGRTDVREIWEVYFALPGHEWRIDAYLLLIEVGLRSGWNLTLERYEGMLLGYEDWQNDWHLDQCRSAQWA